MDKINNAIDYLQSQNQADYDREALEIRRFDRSIQLLHDSYAREEEKFYRNPKRTPALLAAIRALEEEVKK